MHFAHPECGNERRMTRERKLSILPVHRRSLANDIDFIQLCGKYICRIAKPRNYAASCRRESLEGILAGAEALIGRANKVANRINNQFKNDCRVKQ